MNATEILVPRKGLFVRDPTDKNPLPAEGAIKPMIGANGKYWRRRLNCGDVFIKKKITSSFSRSSFEQRKEKKGGNE